MTNSMSRARRRMRPGMTGVKKIIGKMSRPDAIAAIEAAGFSCIYGEAHETYPDPMAVCSKSFATRACQMDWEISSTAKKGMVDEGGWVVQAGLCRGARRFGRTRSSPRSIASWRRGNASGACAELM